MNVENSKAQMRKGVLELCILAIIDQRGEAYPSDILEELKTSDLLVVEGTVYPLLTRLKEIGLLSYVWRESRSGPPRKYYSTTEEGKVFLAQLKDAWQNLVKAVESATTAPPIAPPTEGQNLIPPMKETWIPNLPVE